MALDFIRKGGAAFIIAAVLFGCAAAPPRPDGTHILPPTGHSLEQRRKDMAECYEAAVNGARGGRALLKSEKAPLQGRSTSTFFHRGRPVVNSEGTPSMMSPTLSGYLNPSNPDVTDRYVLCFLSRGYIWPKPKATD